MIIFLTDRLKQENQSLRLIYQRILLKGNKNWRKWKSLKKLIL